MHKNLLLTIFLFISFASFSQTNEIKYGLFGGVDISNIVVRVTGGNGTSDSKVGPHFGALAELPVSKYFAIQPELTYAYLGWKESGDVAATDSLILSNPRYNLNYLCLPVLFKFKIPHTVKNGNGLAAYIGPQLGYLFAANLKGDNYNGSTGIKDGFKSTDISAIGGAEYFLAIGVGISVRYQLGLTNIFSNETKEAFQENYGSDVTVKNNSLTVTIGYRFK